MKAGVYAAAARAMAALAVFALAAAGADERNVGYREISAGDIAVALWYPTDEAAREMRLGPFRVRYARDAAPAGAALPVVVMSHGGHGRPRNHHLTAALLAQNGFVVIAPQHNAEKKARAGLWAPPARAVELARAVKAARALPELRAAADFGDMRALGYSLGGLTQLVAAGAKYDTAGLRDKIRAHCAAHGEEDKQVCGRRALPLWRKIFLLARAFAAELFAPEAPPPADFAPLRYTRMVLVEPAGFGVSRADMPPSPPETLIITFAASDLPPAFHGRHLSEILPADRVTYAELAEGHHYAFIAPFPLAARAQLEAEGITIASDPPDFDRAAFIAAVNARILAFLRE